MKIVPVIDYKQGKVVLAIRGERKKYKPLTQGLFDNPTLKCATETFIKHSDCIYIADLDSIIDNNIDYTLWANFFKRYPDTQFWLDVGSGIKQWSTFMHRANNVRPVVGSESFSSTEQLCTILQELATYKPLLSIDQLGDRLLGPAELISSISLWPKDLIYLQLKRVGTATGPDITWLQHNAKLLTEFNIYIGGGIRDRHDIYKLKEQKVCGVLIASSLHSGAITAEEMKALV